MTETKITTYQDYKVILDGKVGYFYIKDPNDNIVKEKDGNIAWFSSLAIAYCYVRDLIRASVKTLPDFLDNVEIDEDDEFPEDSLYSQLTNMMPGYDIYTWNADEYGSIEFSESYTEIISQAAKKGITDIQCSNYTTKGNTFVAIVVAIKTK